jgi:putative CocE/NonD family hydrolase
MRPVSYYLTSTAGANTGAGDGALVTTKPVKPGRDTVTYDPDNPFPSRGGTICCTGNPKDQPGIFDQADLATRPDVLVYSTPPLTQGLTITGPVRARLYVSSDAKDTDFTAKVLDVDETGKAWNVVDGIVRVRYRTDVTKPVLMEPGKVYPVEVNLKSIAWHFKPGHRIQLYVANSDFPEYERNLNTGGNIFDESTWVVAHNTVHTGGSTASALILPVVPR